VRWKSTTKGIEESELLGALQRVMGHVTVVIHEIFGEKGYSAVVFSRKSCATITATTPLITATALDTTPT
jgi:hypothetical protein